MEKLTMTQEMNKSRELFAAQVMQLEISGFEYRGRTEKGYLFSDEQDHFVTVSVTAHKWETETAEGYDGLGMLDEYETKQLEKAKKNTEKELLKAKKTAEKAAQKAQKAIKNGESE